MDKKIIGFQLWSALVIAGISIHFAFNNPSYYKMSREYVEFTITNHRHSKDGDTGKIWFMFILERQMHPDKDYAKYYCYPLIWTFNIFGRVFTRDKYVVRRDA